MFRMSVLQYDHFFRHCTCNNKLKFQNIYDVFIIIKSQKINIANRIYMIINDTVY